MTSAADLPDDLALAERRGRVLGSGLKQFYEFPFHPVRGAGVWLYDAAGRAYLDAYNNVPHVGHCHPRVVEALARQAALVNTNTRYLHEGIVAYAERLVATMPPGLDTCLFTCTGSEANDLAWRLATAATGGTGALAAEYAYHGNSTAIIALDGASPPEVSGPWVAKLPAPRYPVAGAWGQGEATGAAWAGAMDGAIETLRQRGHRPAAFYFCSLFATDGLFVPPPGFLDDGLARLRAAGGLAIADEVQPGLGRIGTHLWGFQALGVVPDIVTMGKPMGNGHPIGVVVARRDVVDAFFRRQRYFNTFGGNPVSAAVGMAVLDVLEEEALQANARRVGAELKGALEALARRHPLVGEIRGGGLFLGVELLVDRATRQPATAAARRVLNALGREGVLVGLTGPGAGMIKIRPPMVFDAGNAEQLLTTLDRVLAAEESRPPSG
ncbi:MAG: aminotransferase class III-fold pyridoxal phosphate-dependent enzyme [Dongiaceae bacterium]